MSLLNEFKEWFINTKYPSKNEFDAFLLAIEAKINELLEKEKRSEKMYKIEKKDGSVIFNVITYTFAEYEGIDYIVYRIYQDIVIHKIKAENVMQITSYVDFFNKPK